MCHHSRVNSRPWQKSALWVNLKFLPRLKMICLILKEPCLNKVSEDLQRKEWALIFFVRGMFSMVWPDCLMPEIKILNHFLIISGEVMPSSTASHLTGRQEKSVRSFRRFFIVAGCRVLILWSTWKKVLSCLFWCKNAQCVYMCDTSVPLCQHTEIWSMKICLTGSCGGKKKHVQLISLS